MTDIRYGISNQIRVNYHHDRYKFIKDVTNTRILSKLQPNLFERRGRHETSWTNFRRIVFHPFNFHFFDAAGSGGAERAAAGH